MDNLHSIVRGQFPDFVREDYPTFVSFVETYYKWLDQQTVGSLDQVLDIDDPARTFVEYFGRQLDGLHLSESNYDPLFLSKIREIYTAKGSEYALVNVLRIVNRVDAEINYSADQILKASDGRWYQTQSFAIKLIYGEIPETAQYLFVQYPYDERAIELNRIEKIDQFNALVYYDLNQSQSVTSGQIVVFRDSDNNVLGLAEARPSPSHINVVESGSRWNLGQLITIPGSKKDTLARVVALDSNGGIQRVEIIEHGYFHTEDETIIGSPYKQKPLGSIYDLSIDIESTSPLVRHYTASIGDYLDGVYDRTAGMMSGVGDDSYFLEDYNKPSHLDAVYDGLRDDSYFLEDYNNTSYTVDYAIDPNVTWAGYSGWNVFNVENIQITGNAVIDTNLTIEEWLNSRATLQLKFGIPVDNVGYWQDERGLISNDRIRIQDNKRYQQFSYEIITDSPRIIYENTVKKLHPAGTLALYTQNLTTMLECDVQVEVTFPFVTFDVLDIIDVSHVDWREFIKLRQDAVGQTDAHQEHVTKHPKSVAVASDSDLEEVYSETYFAEQYTVDVNPGIYKGIGKGVLDNAYIQDTITFEITKPLLTEVIVSDKALDRYGDTYFAENYVYDVSTLVDVVLSNR